MSASGVAKQLVISGSLFVLRSLYEDSDLLAVCAPDDTRGGLRLTQGLSNMEDRLLLWLKLVVMRP